MQEHLVAHVLEGSCKAVHLPLSRALLRAGISSNLIIILLGYPGPGACYSHILDIPVRVVVRVVMIVFAKWLRDMAF